MKALRSIENIKSLSIIPFFVCPKAESICDDWIYDFQFWDKKFLESLTNKVEVDEVVEFIRSKAAGRRIVCAIGQQNKNKGFDEFVKLYLSSEGVQEKYLFVSGGKVSGIDEGLAEAFENSGGLLINKRISDSELVALYHAADVVWACYLPEYDQSSGVLGRALQYQKLVIVRRGSIAESLSLKSVGGVLSLPKKCYRDVFNGLEKAYVSDGSQNSPVNDARTVSLNSLNIALGED